MAESEQSFRSIIKSALEATVPRVLGEKVAAALRFYVDFDEASANLVAFFSVLSKLIGQDASIKLCRQVLEEIYSAIPGAGVAPQDKGLEEALRRARELFLRAGTN